MTPDTYLPSSQPTGPSLGLTADELDAVVHLLDNEQHDESDYEPERPCCTANRKLKALVVMLNGLTKAETDATASVMGIAGEPVITAALSAPGVERLREWASIGPVQRAAVESFADALAVGELSWTGGDGTHHEVSRDYALRILRWVFDTHGDVPQVDAVAHSKSEYKRRVALGDPNATPPAGVALPAGEKNNG